MTGNRSGKYRCPTVTSFITLCVAAVLKPPLIPLTNTIPDKSGQAGINAGGFKTFMVNI